MKNFLLLLTLFVFPMACSSGGGSRNDCKKCSDFDTQAEVKAYVKKNKECKKRLDHDGDGIYCESLPKK